MTNTKIEWCDKTWNPVTGCYHGCMYCYARKIARRFGSVSHLTANNGYRELYNNVGIPYPFGFEPTFHHYRLNEPAKIKKPQNIFVCSMADFFGEWVPDEWIQAVFDACRKAPQHWYLFLTKNPERYGYVIDYLQSTVNGYLEYPHTYLGASATNHHQIIVAHSSMATWVSIEPLQEEISKEFFAGYGNDDEHARWLWVIIGAETGNRKGKVIPKREWIENIVDECRRTNTPVFMKNSLHDVWQEPLIQEYPWRKIICT